MVIVNPASANGRTAKRWPYIAKLMKEAGLVFEEAFTGGVKDAIRLAREALKSGYSDIIAVGGDGTVNEIVNGFFNQGELVNPEARLGIIATGTGRDFIRSVGLPSDLGQAVAVLARGRTRLVDVGRVVYTDQEGNRANGYFVNVAGAGIDAETAYRVNQASKALGGFWSFLVGLLVTMVKYRNCRVNLEIDGMTRYRGKATVIAVANGEYLGGGMNIAPGALVDSGRFEVIVVDDLSKLEFVKNLPTIYKGTHVQHPQVYCMRGTHIKITSPDKVRLQMDGELPGYLDAEFHLIPRVLNVVC